jgi:hypothetical protein
MRSLLPTLVLAAPLLLGTMTSPTPPQIPLLSNDKPSSGLTKNEWLKVPGNSPAYLKGDPSKNILVLKMFNLIPRVPSRYVIIPFTAVFTADYQ